MSTVDLSRPKKSNREKIIKSVFINIQYLLFFLIFYCPILKRTNEADRRGLNAEDQHFFLADLWSSTSPEEQPSL